MATPETELIAWEHLSPIDRLRLLSMRPDLKPPDRCGKCGGNLRTEYGETKCVQCSAPHTEDGELIKPIPNDRFNLHEVEHYRGGQR